MKTRSVLALCLAMLLPLFTFAADLVWSNVDQAFSKKDGATNVAVTNLHIPADSALSAGDKVLLQSIGIVYRNNATAIAEKMTLKLAGGDVESTSKDDPETITALAYGSYTCDLVRYNFNDVEVPVDEDITIETISDSMLLVQPASYSVVGKSNYPAYSLVYEVKAATKSEAVVPETGALPEETAFAWTPGTAPTGWFTGWGGEAAGNPIIKMIGPSGTISEVYRVHNEGNANNQKWHPYNGMNAKNSYTLSLYGCVDMIETPAEGTYAVLWAMGGSPRTVLAMDSNRKIVLLKAVGGGSNPSTDATISQSIVAHAIKGYHLITVTFDSEKGASLTIDAEDTKESSEFKAVSGAGIQFGSIYGGRPKNFTLGSGLVILGAFGYDAPVSKEAITTLATQYPAAETFNNTIEINAYGESIHLPSITIPDGKQLRVQKGTLIVPAAVEATLGALEFGDINTDDLGFGMELDGTITIVNNKTFTSNDEKTAYDACNAGRGVNFGEWAGVGEFNIRGTFNAPDTVVVVVHDSSKVTINVDGGTVSVKGITAKEPERATINLANGATWTYSEKVSEGDSVTLNEEGEYSIVSDNGAYKLTRAAEEDYVFTETQTVSQTLSGAVSVTVNPGEGGVVTFSAANTFTGGLIVESGTAKTTSATGFGPNNYNSWATPDALGQIEIKDGATLDLANTANTCYAITTAGTITNSGDDIGTGLRQTVKIALSGDATVSGNTFGILAPSHNATTLDLGEHTLTVAMNEGKMFILSNTTISGEGTIKLKSGSIWINKDKALNGTITLDLSEFPKVGGTVATGSAAQLEKIVLAEGQTGWSLNVVGNNLVATYEEPLPEFNPETDTIATTPVLRFSEIMPKPSDKPGSITTEAGYDKNGLESGWVELENTSDKWVDLGDYKFCRANRGKVYTHADYGNFPSGTYIPPHGRYTFYTSERYANSYPEAKDGNTSAFQHGTFDGKPVYYPEYNMMIWGDKVNPKKFPYVTLVYRPAEATADTILETVIIPSDTPEGYSIIVGHDEADDEATARWLCPSPTKNAANTDTSKLTKIGPNVGPAYGTKHSATEFGPTDPAKLGEPYTVTMNVNPIYNAAGTRTADTITAVTLVYRRDLDDKTIGRTPMTKTGADEGGDVWTAEIPAEAIPAAGHLLQWKTEITDAANNTWTSPSFMNKDDGYEWFGTITEPDELNSANLPTWHMFADDLSLKWMDTDTDAQSTTEIPNKARVAIYDASTSIYHDYVRIDLRGNTSSHFNKKSHGLRFSKVNPLTMKDAVQGGEVKEIRKSSLIGEPADPSFMRQMIGFWLWNKMGNKVPFDFPVRCNLNGAFYQLGFHSERFTDELIEDVYGLDKYGYGYKNVGTLISTSAGGAEKKTPDDGNESDLSMLNTNLVAYLNAAKSVNNDNAELTKTVVERFDLPAWLNYLASARITQEMDDVWANISIYRDSAQMLEGVRGTGTWMPLGYDFNVSFGQYYHDGVVDLRTKDGYELMADQDWFKSHPFYGGMKVRCHGGSFTAGTVNNGNLAMESVLQNSKFRRLYLRRLRTLMDQELKAPDTPETEVPFMVKMRELAELMYADSELDHQKNARGENGWDSSFSAIDSWGQANWPKDIKAGVDDIWNNYVVPRRKHLYVTHAAEGHTAEEIGYDAQMCAGIPAAQSSLEELKAGLSAEAVEGGIVIRNTNAEAIDLSGWQVSGPAVMTLPAGTVIDQGTEENPGEVFVVTDRVAYITANESALTDEVIIGNAKAGSGTDIGLTAADGTIIISADVILSPGTYSDVSYDVPVRLAPAGEFEFAGVSFNGGLALGDGDYTLKNKNGFVNSASVVEAPTANITFAGKGTFQLLGAKESGALMTVKDLIVSNGVFSVESKATTSETCAVVVNGGFAVEDKGTVNLKLTKNAAQGRGFFIANKDMFCRIGKGGTFTAELNGPGCRAIQGDKGSVNLEIHDGATVTATGTAADARYFKMKGNIKISGGKVNLTATGAGTELLSCDKVVTISGGTLTLTSTDDCVSAATAINVSGGTIIGSSSANDVLDSNGTISISGGTLVLLSTAEGHEGLDCDPSTPDEKTHTITISGGVVYSLGGKDCDLHLPEAEGQIYTVLTTSTDEGYVIVSDGTNKHIFVKPTNGCKALISIPNMTGDAEEVSVSTEEATPVVDGKYWTILLPSAPETWEEVEVTEDTKVAELVGDEQGAVLEAFKVEPAKIVDWAKTYAADSKPGEAIDLEAFALDCAPNEEAIDAAKKDFKVTITFAEDGSIQIDPTIKLNITPMIHGAAEVNGEYKSDYGDDARFFKAVIDIGE